MTITRPDVKTINGFCMFKGTFMTFADGDSVSLNTILF
jgi:hypothetical protein